VWHAAESAAIEERCRRRNLCDSPDIFATHVERIIVMGHTIVHIHHNFASLMTMVTSQTPNVIGW